MAFAALFSAPSSPHAGRIEFSEPRLASDGYFECTAMFALDGEEWTIPLEMIAPYRYDMLGFFEELGGEASGWDGAKEWESEFAEMRIAARNSGDNTAVLDIRLRWPPEYEIERGGTIHVQADELPGFKERMRAFLRLERGERFRRVG